jgi:hypothetical protein
MEECRCFVLILEYLVVLLTIYLLASATIFLWIFVREQTMQRVAEIVNFCNEPNVVVIINHH